MKTGIKIFSTLAALTLMGNAVGASITVPDTAIQKGTSADINVSYTGDATTTNLDFAISYNDTLVDEANSSISCAPTIPELTALNCSIDTANNLIKGIGVNFGTTALSSTDPVAVITLAILPGAPAVASNELFTAHFFDASGTSTGDQVDVLWVLTVTDGPQPLFGSAPTAAAGVSVSGQISTTIQSDVIIQNNGGDDGSTLNYSCSVTSDPSTKFSISGDTTNVNVVKGSDATVTVACASGAIGGPFTGEMTCDHNGSNGSSAVFPLSCTVTAGPEPAFSAVDAGLNTMAAAEEGDTDPTSSLSITNSGNAGTTLSGTCSLSGDAQISLTGGAFSVAQGAGAAVVAVSCDASAEGAYSSTLSCTHNGTNVATPATYPVSCTVGPPGAAVYASVPAPGSTIDMTPTPVPAGGTVANQVLTITNAAAEANDRDLELTSCGFVGSAEITATAAPATLAPMASAGITFSCDSTNVGDYTGTYTCNYVETGGGEPNGGVGPVAQANYTVDCSIRAAESMLDSTPAPGSTLNINVAPNGTGATFVNVSEVNDEGVDASIDSCTLADGANFTVLNVFPITVPAGGTVQIQIEGTDPGDGNLNFSDTMTCLATDSSGESTVFWELNMNVQTAAIPTLSTWGLLAMILAMFSFGGIMIRRKVRS